MKARLEEWITDEGSGFDLDKITAHGITGSQILVPQTMRKYVSYPAKGQREEAQF